MAVYMLIHAGEFVITKWFITQVNDSNISVTDEENDRKIWNKLEVHRGNDIEVDIEEKRKTLKLFTELLNNGKPLEEIKQKVNFKLIKEEARWKIYSKALDLKKSNHPLGVLELMHTFDQFITEQIRWFFLVIKCSMITRQWKEIEPWKYRFMFLPERQLMTKQFLLGEIGKVFAYHTEMVQRERGIMARNVENEADRTSYGMKLQLAVSHNNSKSFQRALNEARNIMKRSEAKTSQELKANVGMLWQRHIKEWSNLKKQQH
jgi:hypothetical protein